MEENNIATGINFRSLPLVKNYEFDISVTMAVADNRHEDKIKMATSKPSMYYGKMCTYYKECEMCQVLEHRITSFCLHYDCSEIEKRVFNKDLTPLSKIILKSAKEHIKKKCKKNPNLSVSIPACYNSKKRYEVFKILEQANIDSYRLINDISAMALKYCYDNKNNNNDLTNVIMIHIGANATNVGIYQMDNNKIITKVICGDYIGTYSFNEMLINYIIENYADKEKKRRIFNSGEDEIKIFYKKQRKHTCSYFKNKRYNRDELTREVRSTMITNFMSGVLKLIKKALTESNISLTEIQKVVVFGEIAEMKEPKEILKTCFLNKIFFDESYIKSYMITKGAALYEGFNSLNVFSENEKIKLYELISYNVCFKIYNGERRILIHKNTPINCIIKQEFYMENIFNISIDDGNENTQGEILISFTIKKTGLLQNKYFNNPIILLFTIDNDGLLKINVIISFLNNKSIELLCDGHHSDLLLTSNDIFEKARGKFKNISEKLIPNEENETNFGISIQN